MSRCRACDCLLQIDDESEMCVECIAAALDVEETTPGELPPASEFVDLVDVFNQQDHRTIEEDEECNDDGC